TLSRRIKIRNPSSTPSIENEQVPSQEELARIFRNSSSRIRAAEALLAFADLRPETLGNHDGTDGLKVGDLPEMVIVDKQVQFAKVPTRIFVRSNLSKTRQKYFTFLSSEGCSYLKEYLEARIRQGEELKRDSPLIEYERLSTKARPHLPTRKVTALIRKAMRKAGMFKRPYVLRAYAETQLIIAESKGRISHPYLQFIAGHKGDIEARYSTNKGSLPPDMIEGMRAAYKDCEPFLSTLSDLSQQSNIVKEAKIEALKSVARSMFGIDLLDVKIAKENKEKKLLNQDETIELFEVQIKKLREQPDPQTVVGEKELPLYLKEGWQFVSVLPSKRVVIRK
ncbi:MAG: site-specific integrase, partial [Nitrososphaera sp.]